MGEGNVVALIPMVFKVTSGASSEVRNFLASFLLLHALATCNSKSMSDTFGSLAMLWGAGGQEMWIHGIEAQLESSFEHGFARGKL